MKKKTFILGEDLLLKGTLYDNLIKINCENEL